MSPLTPACGIVFIIQVCGEDKKDATQKWYPFINRTLLIKKYSPQSLSTYLSSFIVIPKNKEKSLFYCITLQRVVLNNLMNTVGVSGLSPGSFHNATLFRAWLNVLLGQYQPFIPTALVSHQFAKLWRNLLWGSKTSTVQIFWWTIWLDWFQTSGKDWMPFLSPIRWLILHAVMCRASVPRDSRLLVQGLPEILQVCNQGANRCFRNLQMLSKDKWKVLHLGGNTVCASAGQGLTGLGAALQKAPELLVDRWTWIQQYACAVMKANHILGYIEDKCSFISVQDLWVWIWSRVSSFKPPVCEV